MAVATARFIPFLILAAGLLIAANLAFGAASKPG